MKSSLPISLATPTTHSIEGDPLVTSRYRIGHVIGEGGMALVYAATKKASGRHVAIKVVHDRLRDDPRSRRHLLNEAKALALADHPLIVKLIEHDTTARNLPFLVLERVVGQTLRQAAGDRPMPLARVARLFVGILDALENLHVRGIVHADVKPENIMVVASPGGEQPRLIDFGVAALTQGDTIAAPGEVCGTPGYVAPEVITGGAPTPASDLYGAAVVLYELLTGSPPFAGSSVLELLTRQLDDVPPRLSDRCPSAGSALDRVMSRALDRDQTRRFQDAADFRDAFREALTPPRWASRSTLPR